MSAVLLLQLEPDVAGEVNRHVALLQGLVALGLPGGDGEAHKQGYDTKNMLRMYEQIHGMVRKS